MKKPKIIPLLIITGLIIYSLFFYKTPTQGCTFYSMGGIKTEIKIFNENRSVARDACELVKERYEELESMFSTYRAGSLVSKINREAYKQPIKLSDEVYYLISRSLAISLATEGYFDIAVKPLLDMWAQAVKDKTLPSSSKINRTNKISRSKYIQLDENARTVYFLKPGMQIDLGAIAKGYMADEAKEILISAGIERGLINSGGDIVAFDVSENPVPFKIAVYNPHTGKSDEVISITNGSIVTSGNYSRSYSIQGKEYSHILNPHTGTPRGGCKSITLKASTGLLADALATALCADPNYVMGKNLPKLPAGVEVVSYFKD
ncbi:MAG: FAD:protein FMN transferase [Leptospirales bacterium]